MRVRFHGNLTDAISETVLRMPRVLGEDGEGLLQFDQLPVENVMSYDQHRHPLVEKRRTAQDGEKLKHRIGLEMEENIDTLIYRDTLCHDSVLLFKSKISLF